MVQPCTTGGTTYVHVRPRPLSTTACDLESVAYPGGGGSGCPETPPAMIFLIRGFTSLHAPTFTSHLNLRLLETPLETNSGYATGNRRLGVFNVAVDFAVTDFAMAIIHALIRL